MAVVLCIPTAFLPLPRFASRQVLESANWSALILAKRAAASPLVEPELRARLADQHRLYLSRTCAFSILYLTFCFCLQENS